MIFPSADPIDDFYRQDMEDYEAEQRCPVCDNCGKHIPPDEQVFKARFRSQDLVLCEDCCGEADWQMLSEMEGQL